MTIPKSRWIIGPGGTFAYEGRRRVGSDYNIVLLDDHSIIRDAVKRSCLHPFFPNAKIYEFMHGTEAFDFIRKALENELPVDLLITDYNHRGLDGALLVMNIRALEEKMKCFRPLPIVMLTMMEASYEQELQQYPYFRINKYLNKSADSNAITEAIEELLYTGKKWLVECFLAGYRYYEGEAVFPEMGRGMRLDLRPEPDNAYDSSAVAVYFRDRKIGYVPREKNRLVKAMFDGLRGVPGAQILELNPDGDDWARIKIGVGF